MCDESKIQGVLSSGALDGTISSMVKENIENSDQMNEALYKKGCGLMKKVFDDNKVAYSDKISEILETIIPKIFEDSDFKKSLTSTLVGTLKGLEYKDYLIDEVMQTPGENINNIEHEKKYDVDSTQESDESTVKGLTGKGGSKKLHSKTFKKIRKRKKERKRKQK